MDITRKDNSESQVHLTVTVSEEAVKTAKNVVIKRLARDIDAPGFRKGTAPLNVVEKQLDTANLQAQVLEEAVNVAYVDAARSEKLRPVSNPKIDVTKWVPFTSLEFTAQIDVVPPIKLADYKKISKKLPEVTVEKAEIDDVLNNLATRMADKKDVDRAAKVKDEVLIDFSGVDEKNNPVSGASGTDYPLVLGSNTFIPGFEPEVIGLKSGAEKTFTLTFPKDYAHKPLADKDVTFMITVKKVQEVVAPAIDDEFAKKVAPVDSLTALKKDIKDQLATQKNNEATDAIKDEIVGEIVEKSTFEVPQSLIDDQVQHLLDDLKQNLVYRGITYDEYLSQENATEESYVKNTLEPRAKKRVQAGLVLAEIAEKEDINLTPDELDIRLQLLKGQNPQMAAQFESESGRNDVASRMITEKTVDKLVEYATN